MRRSVPFLVVLALVAGCSATTRDPAVRVTAARAPTPAPTTSTADVPPPTHPSAATPSPVPVVDVAYRVEVRVPDGEAFASTLAATMADPRGWVRAGFRVYEDPSAPYVVTLVEGDEAQRLCRPYDVGSEFSCQNGPMVVINARRWRAGVPHWTGDLQSYRVMLLNHEMGHLLGQHHVPCPGAGSPAPVMFQQSGGLAGCTANPWPLDTEITRAARHDLKLAPAFGE